MKISNRAVSLLLVVWQSLSQMCTAEGQFTTVPPVPAQVAAALSGGSSNIALVAGSSVPASFVGLALLTLSAV